MEYGDDYIIHYALPIRSTVHEATTGVHRIRWLGLDSGGFSPLPVPCPLFCLSPVLLIKKEKAFDVSQEADPPYSYPFIHC